MRQSALLTCKKCGCHFILSSHEIPALVLDGIGGRPDRCHYCRAEDKALLYEEARLNPERLFRYRCSICLRTFVSVRELIMSSPDYYACPECMPDSIPYYSDDDRQLNKDLGYPR